MTLNCEVTPTPSPGNETMMVNNVRNRKGSSGENREATNKDREFRIEIVQKVLIYGQ